MPTARILAKREGERRRPATPGRRRDPRFWPAAGLVLDVLAASEARVGDTAKLLEISTGNLIDFLATDPKLWEEANYLRQKFGQKALKDEN